jgi:hypothetical protein
MTATNSERKPACNLSVFSKAERKAHMELGRRLFAGASGFKETEAGLELLFLPQFPRSDLNAWIAGESRCCSFASYEVIEDSDGLRVAIHTDGEGKKFLRPMYRDLLRTVPSGALSGLAGPGAILAAVLCLSCLLPVVGGMLAARGLMGSFWNPGEMVWMGLGVGAIALWFGISKWRKRGQSNACGC